MTNHELDFDAHQFLVLSRSKQARISRVLAARARNIVNLGPPAHALSFVRIALAWDQLADSMEEHSGTTRRSSMLNKVGIIFGGSTYPQWATLR